MVLSDEDTISEVCVCVERENGEEGVIENITIT